MVSMYFQANQTILGVMGTDVTTSELEQFIPHRKVWIQIINNIFALYYLHKEKFMVFYAKK